MAGLLDDDKDLLKPAPFDKRWDIYPQQAIPGDLTGTSPLRNPYLAPMPNRPPADYQGIMPAPAPVPGGRPMPVMPGVNAPDGQHGILPPPTEPGGRPMPVMPGRVPTSPGRVPTSPGRQSLVDDTEDPRQTILSLFKKFGLT